MSIDMQPLTIICNEAWLEATDAVHPSQLFITRVLGILVYGDTYRGTASNWMVELLEEDAVAPAPVVRMR